MFYLHSGAVTPNCSWISHVTSRVFHFAQRLCSKEVHRLNSAIEMKLWWTVWVILDLGKLRSNCWTQSRHASFGISFSLWQSNYWSLFWDLVPVLEPLMQSVQRNLRKLFLWSVPVTCGRVNCFCFWPLIWTWCRSSPPCPWQRRFRNLYNTKATITKGGILPFLRSVRHLPF